MTAARLADVAAQASAFGEQLVRAGILRDVRPLEFEHALVRDAVLSAMTAGERARLHADAARILGDAGAAPEAIAVHLLHAEPVGTRRRRPACRGWPARAGVGSADRGRGVAGAGRRRAASRRRRARRCCWISARAEHGLGRPEAIDRVLAAYDAALDEVDRAEAALGLMWATGPGGRDPHEMVAMIERGAPRHRRPRPRARAQARVEPLMASFMAPALFEQARRPGRAVRGPRRPHGRRMRAAAARGHPSVPARRAADEVAEPVERAVADPQLVAAIGPDSAWLPLAIGQLFKTDRLEVARRTVAIALAEARRRGSAPGFAGASAWRAWIALREGAAAEAEADARAAYDAPSGTTWQHLFSLVLPDRRAGRARRARRGAGGPRRGAPRTRSAASCSSRPARTCARREGTCTARSPTSSRRAGSEATALAPDPDFDGWLRIARLLHATGDEESAAREAEAALSWARTWGTPGYLGQALTVSGLIRGGDEGLAQLHEAVAQLERSPARRELARSLIDSAPRCAARGERKAAREPLRRALDLAAAGGLVATAERAREELRVTGAKVRRAESSGLDSLTPSERRIVELAAGGASNPEIAQALFVTVKTVEMHLGNAYRKLGINSRRQLAALLPPEKLQGASTGTTP